MSGRLLLVACLFIIPAPAILAHCQVPCGIYADDLRIKAILEDVRTIEKAMAKIEELSAAEKPNYNQIVRWVNTKEEHATRIQRVVNDYFLTQRIKTPKEGDDEAWAKYHRQLATLHQILVAAMKSKQTLDQTHCKALRGLVHDFCRSYFSVEDIEHLKLEHGDDD